MSNTPSRIYFVRHAESQAQVDGIFGGDTPLSTKGRLEVLNGVHMFEDKKLAVVYSSNQLRGRETASVFQKSLHIPHIIDSRLRERSWGEFEGKSYESIKENVGSVFQQLSLMTDEKRKSYIGEYGIESEGDVLARVKSALFDALNEHLGRSICIISHGAVMRILLLEFGFVKTYDQARRLEIDNLGHFIVETNGLNNEVTAISGIHC